ncbi:MAG: TRAP transporter TatT component family protein [Lysobacteraceae bacterium]
MTTPHWPRFPQPTARRWIGLALAPEYDHGSAWIYLGVLYSLRPAAVGGEPDKGRAAFERAMELSGGRHLMAQTQFAQQYARLVFDQALHDQLLQQVIAADPREPGLTLNNASWRNSRRESCLIPLPLLLTLNWNPHAAQSHNFHPSVADDRRQCRHREDCHSGT